MAAKKRNDVAKCEELIILKYLPLLCPPHQVAEESRLRTPKKSFATQSPQSGQSEAAPYPVSGEQRFAFARPSTSTYIPSMCGRVRLSSDYSEIKIRLKFAPNAPAPNFEPDWNKPPTGLMLVAIRSVDGERVAKMMRWGLLPHWAKDEKLSFSTFNAAGKKKQPYAIDMADGKEMVHAGLWSSWRSLTSGEEILSCTIFTCAPNASLAEIHDRMPVILDEADWPKWLGEEPATEEELVALLKPCPDETLKIWPVDKAVGNVKNNGAHLAKPLDAGADSLFGPDAS
jgi:putative SOS response-associated peptidase YedK